MSFTMWAQDPDQHLGTLQHNPGSQTIELEVTYNPYSADDARRMVQNRIGCPKKAQQDLGFTYQYDFRTGLQRLIDWRNQHGAE